jgi:1,4-alpha-glucan branching enzyme
MSSFVLVLHGHLPWVVHHGRWPHGEEWLHEAVAETWLPLLEALDEVKARGARAPITIGLTPVLLEQLQHPRFQDSFPAWLDARIERATRDEDEFAGWGDQHLARLARDWQTRLASVRKRFDGLDGDLCGAFARLWNEGRIEVMGSAATHAYLPLLREDRSVRRQIETGLEVSERILGRRPEGFWLPECAYRPSGTWRAHVLDDSPVERRGLDELLADAGVRWTVVDAHLVRGARSEGVLEAGTFSKVGWDQARSDQGRMWRSPLEPHRVSSPGTERGVDLLTRHPQVSEQVWSSKVGYPGDGRYLEFHKRHGEGGLRYWRVSSVRADLEAKERYDPDQIPGTVYSHAQHFCAVVRGALQEHAASGREGVLVAPFDAELFGHWWHEGPAFLLDVLLTLGADDEVHVDGASEALERVGVDKVVWLPEGSWGEGGDDRVWTGKGQDWMWEVAHRAEERLAELQGLAELKPDAAQVLALAERELLLLQASDWWFAISRGSALDYASKRFAWHAGAFDRLCDLAWDLQCGEPPTSAQQALLRACSEMDQP